LIDLQSTIESMVHAILEDANKRHPHSMDELMHIHECSNDKTIITAPATGVSVPSKAIKAETAAFEVLRASLGLIFGERYGWTEEAIDDMTLPEVFIALEHAMEYDDPTKKSVW